MSRATEPFTPAELREIAKRRAAAAKRARKLAATITPEEDARILAAALSDADAQPLTDEQLARMRPAHEVVPWLVARQLRSKGGRPKLAAPKKPVTLRLKPAVLEAYRASGPGWQTRMAEAIEKHAPRGPKG
jgi:uncharacterized protein (DUF4415 family)